MEKANSQSIDNFAIGFKWIIVVGLGEEDMVNKAKTQLVICYQV